MVGGFVNDENKRAGANNVSEPFNLRLPHKTREKLDAVAAMLPILSAHRIALAALDIGLDALAANPSKVLSVEVAPRGTAMRGARGTGPGDAVSRGAAGASPNDHAPEEPPLVRAPSMPPPRVPVDIVVPEAVELDDDHEPVNGAGQLALIAEPPAAPAPDAAAVRARLKALQAAEPRAWSLRKIADLAGVSTAPVAKVLNGQKVTPKYLAAIAAILPPEHTGKAST